MSTTKKQYKSVKEGDVITLDTATELLNADLNEIRDGLLDPAQETPTH